MPLSLIYLYLYSLKSTFAKMAQVDARVSHVVCIKNSIIILNRETEYPKEDNSVCECGSGAGKKLLSESPFRNRIPERH